MHYRNGREAKNGDKVVQLTNGAAGILFDAKPGNDYCNGYIGPAFHGGVVVGACLIDCLHAEDFEAMLAEKGLDKRPPGK
jgi:hypothetical protein